MLERAARLLRQMTPAEGDLEARESYACALWRGVVGKRIARHARAERLVRTRLIVGVDDAVWQRQLFTMRSLILSKLQAECGAAMINEVEFRVSPPRREPQRATRSMPAQGHLFDEADKIIDPVLRRLYVVKRKRELA
jgi:predicted nucleic acid-binding Zn ribbon protein